ncbi:Ribonuclease H-like domain,Integrase, catalytic core,Macro domain, partial [Cinara cedri]
WGMPFTKILSPKVFSMSRLLVCFFFFDTSCASAFSFPIMPVCVGTHMNWMVFLDLARMLCKSHTIGVFGSIGIYLGIVVKFRVYNFVEEKLSVYIDVSFPKGNDVIGRRRFDIKCEVFAKFSVCIDDFVDFGEYKRFIYGEQAMFVCSPRIMGERFNNFNPIFALDLKFFNVWGPCKFAVENNSKAIKIKCCFLIMASLMSVCKEEEVLFIIRVVAIILKGFNKGLSNVLSSFHHGMVFLLLERFDFPIVRLAASIIRLAKLLIISSIISWFRFCGSALRLSSWLSTRYWSKRMENVFQFGEFSFHLFIGSLHLWMEIVEDALYVNVSFVETVYIPLYDVVHDDKIPYGNGSIWNRRFAILVSLDFIHRSVIVGRTFSSVFIILGRSEFNSLHSVCIFIDWFPKFSRKYLNWLRYIEDELLSEKISSAGLRAASVLLSTVLLADMVNEHLSAKAQNMIISLQVDSCLQPIKCEFLRKEVTYLGHRITDAGVTPDPQKVECVQNFPVPKNVKEIKSFLGLSGYYRQFIPNYGQIAKPLISLLKKDVPYRWNDLCQEAFETLKNCLIKSPILQYPDFTYASRTLNKLEEYQYTIHFKSGTSNTNADALSRIHRVVTRAQPQPENSNHPTTKPSSKKSYTNLMEVQGDLFDNASTASLVHCVSSDFKMNKGIALTIRRKFGNVAQLRKLNKKVTEVASLTVENRTIFYFLTKEHHWQKPSYQHLFQSLLNLKKLCKERHITQLVCPRLGCGLDGLKWETVRSMICYIFQNSAIKIKVVDREPLTEDEQQRVIREFHENPLGGHQGIARTYQRISQQYHWKGMRQMIKNYILSCATCQLNKTTNRTIKEPMVIMTTASRPFEKIFMDILGPLPKSYNGNVFILTLQDDLSKFAWAASMANHEASTVAFHFVNQFVCLHGLPQNLVTDCGAEFLSKPYELVYGHEIKVPNSFVRDPEPQHNYNDYYSEMKRNMQEAHQLAKRQLQDSKIKAKERYDKSANPLNISIGEKVMMQEKTSKGKLAPKWLGPFTVIGIQSDSPNITILRKNKPTTLYRNLLKPFVERN